MTSVLVVDDQPMIRLGLQSILDAQDDIEVVGECGNGQQAVSMARQYRPDVVLMDIRMPVMDGIEATRQILTDESTRTGRVLILSTFELDEYVYDALHAGASGFILKSSEPADIVQAVRTVASGQATLAPEITRRLIERFATLKPRKAESPALFEILTEREHEVLLLMAAGLPNADIARRLLIGGQTTKGHVSRILQKLELRDRVQAVVYCYENGVVVPGGATG